MKSKNIDTSTIGGRIKKLREINGITQEQLKEQLFIAGDSTRVSKIENNRTQPNCQELIAMSKIFNTTTDYILQGNIEAVPLPVVTPEEQGFILTWAEKIKTCQNRNLTC